MRWANVGLGRRSAFITLAVGLITAAIGITVIHALERDGLIRAAAGSNLAAAERAALRIDDRVAAFRTKVEILADTNRLLDPELSLPSTAATILRSLPEADEVIIYDEAGEPIAAAASARLLPIDELPGRPPSEPDQPGTTTSWHDPSFQFIEVTVTIEDPPGNPVGLLAIRAPVTLLVEEALAASRNSYGATMLTASDGTLVAHPDSGRLVDPPRFDLRPLTQTTSYELVEGDRRTLVSGVPLRSLPAWVLSERSRSDVLQPAAITFGRFTWVFLAVITAMTVALLFGLRRTLRPLQAVTAALDRVRHGDHSARIPPVGAGEAGMLVDGFNRMVQELEDREHDLRRSERGARSTAHRLQLLIDGATDSAIFFVDLHGNVRSWNTGARRLLAYREEEIIGQPLARLFTVDEIDDPLALVTGRNRVHLEGWCIRREGSRFRAQLSLSAFHDQVDDHRTDDGQQPATRIGYAAIVNDLTDREIAQRSVREALEHERAAADDLRRAAEIKDEFLAIAAHELRTPLSAVLGSISVLADEYVETPEQRQELYDIIGASADDMHDITERLLDLSRLQTGHVRLVDARLDLRGAIEGHLDALQHDLQEHVVELDVRDATVVVDPDALRHIVTNLVSNAAKFSPTGSTIEVDAALDGDTLTVTVVDEGPGIATEDHDRIFELFRRSGETTVSGTGVGLAIVKRYVDLADGELRLDSAPGAGASFTVRIPTVADGARAEAATGAPHSGDAPRAGERDGHSA